MVASAVAARTTRIRTGSMAVLLPLHHPVRVAEEVATVDLFSRGRMILGVAGGYADRDFNSFGVKLSWRPSLCEEGIEIIKRAWTMESFSFHGKRYQLNDVKVTPKPVQKPRPPIWVGASKDAAVRRAAKFGDAYAVVAPCNLRSTQDMSTIYRPIAESLGKKPHVVVTREAWVSQSSQEAEREYGPHVLTSHRFYFRIGAYEQKYDPWISEINSEEEFTLKKAKPDRFIMGSPDDCISEIEKWSRTTGAEYFLLRFHHPTGPPHKKVLDAIKLFGEKVIPFFRDS